MSEVRPLLAIHELSVRYGDTVAVDRTSLEVPEGTITALLGPSGCGKTSLLRAIAGFEVPAEGTIEIAGETVAGPGRWVEPEKRQVGMVFQEGALFPHLTVHENVLYGAQGGPEGREAARQALVLVGMERFGDRYPDELSGGQQQRIALARALAPSPKIVLLDEPFANLDATLRQRVREEVRAILEKAEITAILVTHDQEEGLSIADRVSVMTGGTIRQTGTPEEIYHRPATPEIARFVGDGQLVACRVEKGRVRSVFGSAGADAPDGPGLVLVRPEDLRVLPADAETGVPGVLTRRRFYGHDLIDEVKLENGEILLLRTLSSNCPTPGTEVRLGLRDKKFHVFPGAHVEASFQAGDLALAG